MEMLRSLVLLPFFSFLDLPGWALTILVGLMLSYKMAIGGWILARSGRSPLWVLALLAPFAELIAVWVLAYAPWPAETLAQQDKAHQEAVGSNTQS